MSADANRCVSNTVFYHSLYTAEKIAIIISSIKNNANPLWLDFRPRPDSAATWAFHIMHFNFARSVFHSIIFKECEMKRLKTVFAVLSILFLSASLHAQKTDDEMTGGILYGPNWACIIQAPDGWILDNQSWADYGIYAMFYPKGMSLSSPSKEMPIIYFKAAQLDSESDSSLKTFVDGDIKECAGKPGTVIKARDIKMNYAGAFYCYDFDYTQNGQYETVIYIRYKDGVHLIILTSKDKAARDHNIQNLIGVVEKLSFMEASVKN